MSRAKPLHTNSETAITVTGADVLRDNIQTLNRKCPDYLYNAVARAGRQLRKEVITKTKQVTKQRTGNLAKGFVSRPGQRGIGSGREFFAEVSGGNNSAPHFHLIEHGHKRIAQIAYLRGRRVQITPGFTQGYHMMQSVKTKWESDDRFVEYINKAVEKAMKDGFG